MSKNKEDGTRKGKDSMTSERWKYLKQEIVRLKGTNSYLLRSKSAKRKRVVF